jgi:hypothetical protein
MVLIAAIGVGLALVMSFLSDTHSLLAIDGGEEWRQWEGIFALLLALMASTLGLALTWIGRLRRPFRLFSQSPGAIACLLASVVIVAVAYHLAVNYTMARLPADWRTIIWRMGYWSVLLGHPPTAIGLLILCVWNLLVISGSWKAEPTWLDRVCRMLGVCWIVWAVIESIVITGFQFMHFYRTYGF